MKRALFIVIAIVFVLSFSACEQLSNLIKGTTTPTVRPKGPVLAKVGNWILTVNEFDQQVNNIIEANKGEKEVPVANLGLLARTFISPLVEKIDLSSIDGKQIYLELLVNLELLAQEAESRGLNKDPQIAKSIRRSTVEILDFSLLNDVLKNVTVTPLEVENFYNNEYKKTLEGIEQRKVSEIVVDSEYKAKDILVELLRGANFSTLAKQNSVSESAKDGGDLGYIVYNPNMKFTKFWEVVLTSDQGQVSSIFKDPLKTEYYIIKIEDIKKGEVESLSKVYDNLEFLIRQKKSIEAIDELIESAKAKSDVTIRTELIK